MDFVNQLQGLDRMNLELDFIKQNPPNPGWRPVEGILHHFTLYEKIRINVILN